MADREKIIRGLHCCSRTCEAKCVDCPYDMSVSDCTAQMSMDVLELLKEGVNEKSVSIELFLEVLDKYKESKYGLIWNRSVHIREDLKALDEEISKYKKLVGM